MANADGSNPRKVSEDGYSYRCGFSEEFVPLIVTTGRSISIIRHDLENGEETTLLTGVEDRLAISPDGRSFLFVSGLDLSTFPSSGSESLEILDIATGQRHLLHGPHADASYHGLIWSPDGQRVGFIAAPPRSLPVGSLPPPGPTPSPNSGGSAPPGSEAQGSPSPFSDYGLYVRDLTGAEATLVYQFEEDDFPYVEWSPSGEWLLIGGVGVGPKTQPFIGVYSETLPTREAEELGIEGGALTHSVVEDGPSAGILEWGDVITAINGEKITSAEDIGPLVRASNPGDVLTLTIYRVRTRETLEVDVTVGQRDVPPFERELGYVLVNVESGETRQVLSVDQPFEWVFYWAPDKDMFAYVYDETLFLESVNGDVLEVPLLTSIEEACSSCNSFGWSPDGSYIGLTGRQTLAVLDTATGEIRSLLQEEKKALSVSPIWWR